MSVAMIGQFLLSLSLLIVLHECGHFFPAIWFKTRVEKFYLFFDPYFSLFKKKIGDTEYGIGWLPLGGYVKISGMVDESMDKEQMKQPPQPWEFRSKKAWQRLIIMLGGVTVNFVLGFLIFSGLIWHYGEDYLPAENAKFGIYADSLGQKIGLQTGDKIIKVGQKPFDKFDDRAVLREIVFSGIQSLEIERSGQKMSLPIPEGTIDMMTRYENKEKQLFSLPMLNIVNEVISGKPAEKAGLQKGDQMISLNGESMPFFQDFYKNIQKHKNETITLQILRGKDTLTKTVQLGEDGFLGFRPENSLKSSYETKHSDYSFAQALPMGLTKSSDFLVNQVKAFGKMFRGEIKAKESVGGFKSIAQMFGKSWDWERFWTMTASLSLILAFMNLLPIPALDGGYVMFLLWEVFTGKRVSDEFMEKAVTVGFMLLLTLIVVINFWDFIR